MHVFDVPLVRASEATLAGMGRPLRCAARDAALDIVPWPRAVGSWRPRVPDTGDEGGEVAGAFTAERVGAVQYSVNCALQRRYIIGWYGEDPAAAAAAAAGAAAHPPLDSILTHEANYHGDGGQIICSRDNGAFVLLLAPPGDDVAPASFRAFLVDPAHDGVCGVHINAGTWHQPAFPLRGAANLTLDNRQGRVHECVGVDFLREFGAYLRVPLSPAALREGAAAPPPPLAPKPPRLGYTIIYVRFGVARSLEFYERAFGMRRRLLAPAGDYGELETGATALAFCDAALARQNFGGAADAFAAAERGAPPPPVQVGIVVQDVDAAFARAVAAGAEAAAPPETKPWGHRVSYVRDLEGFLVEICGEMAGGESGS